MKRKGFTLIEVLIYIAVLGIIISAISSFLLWTIDSYAKGKALRESMNNAKRAMDIMTYEIKEAKSIYTPNTTSTQLSLETTHYLPTGEDTTYIDFYICENRLCLKKEDQDPIAISSDRVEVESLSFVPVSTLTLSGSSVQINLTIKYKNPANLPKYEASTNLISTVSLRSY